ncbi:MAG: hypothetical protein QM755_22660 [Luteolibacter sp.]
MKKAFALLAVLMSGGYLLTLGIAPDPLPLVDEATALLILVKSLSVLGIDVSRFIPFLGRKTKQSAQGAVGQTVDI